MAMCAQPIRMTCKSFLPVGVSTIDLSRGAFGRSVTTTFVSVLVIPHLRSRQRQRASLRRCLQSTPGGIAKLTYRAVNHPRDAVRHPILAHQVQEDPVRLVAAEVPWLLAVQVVVHDRGAA